LSSPITKARARAVALDRIVVAGGVRATAAGFGQLDAAGASETVCG
jgi:hypothetical protein